MALGETDPTEINILAGQRVVAIAWADGHRSELPLDLLRKECPCAECNDLRQKSGGGGLTLTVLQQPVVRAGEAAIEGVSMVGRYAINIQWKDGHNTGIYTFQFLRALCPCGACAGARG